ncbi:MAG: murein biosynthesis integral membrane protein MurJ [Chloroflexota bacterium]|nr:murein biosynthesis integral membrane protein MurJ [Chloroflexota bacterium]
MTPPLNFEADNQTEQEASTKAFMERQNLAEIEGGVEPGAHLVGPSSAVESTPNSSSTRRFGGGIIRAALIISLGNIMTRIFGLLRESVLAGLAGTGALTTAFVIADNTLSIFFDLLVSGAISAALVPVLSRYAARTEDREEFWRIVNTLLTLGLLFLMSIVALLELFADPLARFMAVKENIETQNLTVGLVRIILFGIIFLGVSSIMMATLQALQRFAWSALSLAARNGGVVLIALLCYGWLGVWSLVLGVLVGTFLLIVLQAPGLRDLPFRPSFDFRHPALGEILRLYRPIFLGLLVTSAVLIVDRNLANQTGSDSIGAMRYATTLQQFVLGLVGSAISIAILPTLSRQAEAEATSSVSGTYRQTLMSGLRLLCVLIIPATIGLLTLALPAISLIFERGAFKDNPYSKALTLVALLGYLPGLPAAALDQMLIVAFYARKNTLLPVVVGVFANFIYLIAAFSLMGSLGMLGLVLANSLQQIFHMVVMFWLLRRHFGRLGGYGLTRTALKTSLASVVMGVISFFFSGLALQLLGDGFLANLIALSLGVGSGGITYLVALRLLKVDEMALIWGAVRRKLGRTVK